MKKLRLTPDQFTKWIAKKIMKIENYNFDAFYDINYIMNEFKANKAITGEKRKETILLAFRSNGTHLFRPDSNLLKDLYIYIGKHTLYECTFFYNYTYFGLNDKFVEITLK